VALLRRNVEGPGTDRHLAPEIEHAYQDVRSGALVRAVEQVIGELA
jgi:histidine ammonia-lyase